MLRDSCFLSTNLPFFMKHTHMTPSLVTVILFKRPLMPFSVMMARFLGVRVVYTIHDAHTDAHLELGFVLVLVPILDLDLVLACSWLCSFHPLWVRPFPQWLLFSARCGFFVVGAAVNSSLFSTVRTCVRFTC